MLSVIVPARDAGPYIEAALRSALSQTVRDLEVVVVDDGSRDDTRARVAKFEDARVRLIAGEGRGWPAARNRAMAVAKGRHLAFLDADDVWRPDHLERLAAKLDQRADLDLVFSAVAWIDEHGTPLPRTVVRWDGPISYDQLFLEFAPVTCSSICVRREAALRVGGFDEELPTGADHDFSLRVACLRPDNCAGLPDVGIEYRRCGGQITANRERKAAGWEALARKHRGIAPAAVAKLEPLARANHQRALCALAYEAGAFAEARAWLAKAVGAAPAAMARDRRTWIAGAAATATLLPRPVRLFAEKVGTSLLQARPDKNLDEAWRGTHRTHLHQSEDRPVRNAPLDLSVGVFANNEEASIASHLESLYAQRTRRVAIREVIVVSSGSSDRTDALVAEQLARRNNLRLLTQPTRQGKASAVNLFLSVARYPHCVLANADTLLAPDAVEALASPLLDPSIAMVGGHPVPVSPQHGALGQLAKLFWELHHRLCLRAPKMGELVAFRRLFDALPTDEAGADEDWIHGEILRQGFEAIYAPEAILYNCGQRSYRDLVAHRCRMAVQHRELGARHRRLPTSRDLPLVLSVYFDYLVEHPREWPTVLELGAVELLGRAVAFVRWQRGETCAVWRPLTSKGISFADVAAFARTQDEGGSNARPVALSSPPAEDGRGETLTATETLAV